VTYALTTMFGGQHDAVEPYLVAAESAMRGLAPGDEARDLVGRIALVRATLAVMKEQAEVAISQARHALAHLQADNRVGRTAATWLLGVAQQFQGDRAAAIRSFGEVIATGQAHGESLYTIAATINLGRAQEMENRLALAAAAYRRALEMAGESSRSIGSQAHLGLARIAYEHDDLDAAHDHAHQYVRLTRQLESAESFAAYATLVSRLKLAQGDGPGAMAVLDEADAFVHARGFAFQASGIADAKVKALLRLGRPAAAAQLARAHALPLAQARVLLAQGDPTQALERLGPLRRTAEASAWHDERLEVLVLQALAHQAQGATVAALQALGEALEAAAPGGMLRVFLDEGAPMARLLANAAGAGELPAHGHTVAAAFEASRVAGQAVAASPALAGGEALSPRELEVLRLVSQGFSNRDISEQLFLALSTVKGHNMKIFEKLQVKRRTEAVARARALGLL
jgi:LuxR family maltose regulon positive regulatory protein